MKLVDAMNPALTLNGAVTNKTTLSGCLDLFVAIGSSRGKDVSDLVKAALKENPDLTTRILLWTRDCRGGAGERTLFRDNLLLMINEGYKEQAILAFMCTPEVGYWKDVIYLMERSEDFMFYGKEMIKQAIEHKDSLCAKYMPRQGKTAIALADHLGLKHSQWRKLVVGLTSTVEQKMCAKDWQSIDYSKLPSYASARYMAAFHRNDEDRYTEYRKSLVKGETKINASVLYPYDVLRTVAMPDVQDAMWKALPNYLEGTKERILPMVDVSGSMLASTAVPRMTCMDIAISLGLYLSERCTGAFKDTYLTFSASPRLTKVEGDTLYNKARKMRGADWGMNTDLNKSFKVILGAAKRNSVPPEEMPTMMVILSDMEFDESHNDDTNLSGIQELYEESGYELPKIVFWNLNPRFGCNPITTNDKGVCEVSGFSPAIMKSVLTATKFDPYQVMIHTIMNPRYDF